MTVSRMFNPGQYRILLEAGLRLSFTGSRGDQEGASDDGSRHLLGAAYALTLSTLVAALLFQNAAPGQFLLVTMTLSMVFTGTAVIQELASGLFHPQDLIVTGHLPVPDFTRFAARLSVFGCMLIVLTLNLNLAPSVLLFFSTGSNLMAPFACMAAALAASIFMAAICLVLYFLLAHLLSKVLLEGALLYLNILISMGVFSLMINTGHLIQSGALQAVQEGDWYLGYPPSWFSGLALYLSGMEGADPGAAVAAVAALAAALLLLLPVALFSEALMQALGGADKRRGRWSAPGRMMALFERLFVRPDERAAFEFTAIQLSRDRGFRLKAYPILAFPVLIISFSLFEHRNPLFFILMLHLANLYLVLIISFLQYSDWSEGGWIFKANPVKEPALFSRGVEKAFLYRIIAPLFLLNGIVLAAIWEVAPALLHSFYAMLAGLLITGMAMQGLAVYPFSRAFRGVISQHGTGGTLFVGWIILGLIVWAQYQTRFNVPALIAQIAIMLALHGIRYYALGKRREARA